MAQRSKVTAESSMGPGIGGVSIERKARQERPTSRRQAVEVRREIHRITEVQIQGTASHDHDDRYLRLNYQDKINAGRADIGGAVRCDSISTNNYVRVGGSLSVSGSKNSYVNGLYYAATESDRARFWVMVPATEDEDVSAIMARLPDEFLSVTQAPYWVSGEPGYDAEGNVLGFWARVTADVRDDLGPQQAPFGQGSGGLDERDTTH